jgi:RNA polymerase sigma-70 factor (ECF subfamily)
MAHAGALPSSIGNRSFRAWQIGSTLGVMAPAVTRNEAALAHAAAAGDGQAFATLYERYEGRAFNLALRITGSRDDAADATQDAFLNVMRRLPDMGDRELNFGSYLFTAARNACYDLMAKRRRADPTDEIPETAAPMAGGGGFGFDPGDPADDPERGQLLDAQQEEIREANGRLPERQREVLALYELEEMSYDDIAEVMDMNRNSVAQLVSRARIKLRDELRGTAMATIAVSTEECERALPLIAMQDDGQLDADSEDGAWLADHVGGCDTCRLSREAMQEAGASYRAWVPVAAAPFLMEETMARAAELTGSDWSEAIAERVAARAAAGGTGAAGGGTGVASALSRHRRRDGILASILAAVVLLVGFEVALEDDSPPTTAEPAAADVEPAVKKVVKKKAKRKTKAQTNGPAAAADPDQPVASGEPPADSGATGTSSPGDPVVKKAPVKKRVTKTPTPQVEPDPVVEEPPVVVEPPSRTDDPQCVPTRTNPRC